MSIVYSFYEREYIDSLFKEFIFGDTIYGMKEVMAHHQKRVILFFSEYGKITAVLCILIFFFVSLFFLFQISLPKKMKVSFLDVGQGDAILIQTPDGHDMLVDGGPSDRVLEKISQKINYFDHHLDVIIATHPDADHVTGLIPILAHYKVDTIVTSPAESKTAVFGELEKSMTSENASIHIAKTGDEIIFGDGVVAHVLYPSKNLHVSEKDTNGASVSIVVTYGDESVLLTGDLPSNNEAKLLTTDLPQHITIYKAGHHGSKYSSGEQLLSYIKPEYSVISAGKDNMYGHPNSETLERLQMYSKEILSTIEKGTVSFSLDGTSVEVMTDK